MAGVASDGCGSGVGAAVGASVGAFVGAAADLNVGNGVGVGGGISVIGALPTGLRRTGRRRYRRVTGTEDRWLKGGDCLTNPNCCDLGLNPGLYVYIL